MNNISMIFSMPPSTNDLWGHHKNGVYLKDGARQYKAHVQDMLDRFGIDPKINIPVEVQITTHFADNRTHDVDNIVKILFDSFTAAGFWEDDVLVNKFSVERGELHDTATINVEVLEYVRSW